MKEQTSWTLIEATTNKKSTKGASISVSHTSWKLTEVATNSFIYLINTHQWNISITYMIIKHAHITQEHVTL
jgi:hypothetical protein